MRPVLVRVLAVPLFLSFFILLRIAPAQPFTAQDLLRLQEVKEAGISPNGEWIAYVVEVPRTAADKPGSAYKELHVVSVKNGKIQPFITGKVRISDVAWKPDGSAIGFLYKQGNDKTQVWMIPVSGGDAKQLTHSPTKVYDFRWHPKKNELVYIAATPETAREQALKDLGYDFIFYEENLKHRNLYLQEIGKESETAQQLTEGVTVWTFEFSPDGTMIAATVSPQNLIDHRYMFRKIHLLNVKDKTLRLLVDTPGKLGEMAFSPDGAFLTFTAALERKDHQVSQVFVVSTAGGEAKNLTVPHFRGHVNRAGWKDNNTIIYRSFEGMETTLSAVEISGGERQIILNSADTGVVFEFPDYTPDFRHFAFVGESPTVPGDVYYWNGTEDIKRMTRVNPLLTERELGKQEIIRYKARDGMEIEGLLIYPLNHQDGQRYPLITIVHGGPEHNYSNEWVTRYSEPGQVLAGKGYAVFYPNYRSSTGYGLDFALQGLGDPAGKEFDDIADGIDYLVEQGIADRERVGLGGGSYGGYAAAWFASYYTRYVKAVCMFVGVSDLISRHGTTDIPYEEMYVHSGKKLEDMWEFSLRRSPLYWAFQSKTAVLILGGTADTRVHPSQSLEFYRRLKMNDHPAVRLVRYPGEKHGNKKQSSRMDAMYRILDWYDWYVKDAKPLDGLLPPLNVSDKFGLNLPE